MHSITLGDGTVVELTDAQHGRLMYFKEQNQTGSVHVVMDRENGSMFDMYIFTHEPQLVDYGYWDTIPSATHRDHMHIGNFKEFDGDCDKSLVKIYCDTPKVLPVIKAKQADFMDELADLLAKYDASIKSESDISIMVKGAVLPHSGKRKKSREQYRKTIPTISARTIRKCRLRHKVV